MALRIAKSHWLLVSRSLFGALCAAASLHGVVAAVATSEAAESRPPNIVLIMADDFGYECLQCDGGESYETPRLDRLAAQGMRFTRAYAQPLCTPSRVKLMTGLSNVRNYVDFGLLKEGSRTFGHMLQEAGYQTAIVGKWQLLGRDGKKGRGTHPGDAGFHEYCLWQVKDRQSRYWKPLIEQDGKVLPTTLEDFGPDIFAQYAADFMSRNKEKPFFLYFPMALTHAPFVSTPANKGGGRLGPQRAFAGMVTYADQIVGRLVDHLGALGIADNTLLLFTGDNGTPGQITSMLNGKAIRGGKGKTTEAGMHVPLIASWPGTIKPGVCEDLVDFSDIVPTLAEACQARHPNAELADGRSFLSQLRGEHGNPRESIFCFYMPQAKSKNPQRFVRNVRWKLYGDGRMFDVIADPMETAPLDEDALGDDGRAVRGELQAALDTMPATLATASR